MPAGCNGQDNLATPGRGPGGKELEAPWLALAKTAMPLQKLAVNSVVPHCPKDNLVTGGGRIRHWWPLRKRRTPFGKLYDSPSSLPLPRLASSGAPSAPWDPLMARKSKILLPTQNLHAGGVDVGSTAHYVCVGTDPDKDVRCFGTFTADLNAMADWLKERGVTTIALESTGVYWIPVFEVLERRGLHVILVDPRQTRRSGRPKTDVLDCQWIWRLHAAGLLSPSFRPPDMICEFRGYLRRRLTLTQDAGRYIQQMQKAMQQMNVRLDIAVSDITGKTGLRIIKDILRGQRDPAVLAQWRDSRCAKDEATIAKALEGNWRNEHLFALQQGLDAWEFCIKQMRQCDERLQACLRQMPKKQADIALEPRDRARGCKPNDPTFDARDLLAQVAGVDITAIEGIEISIALTLLAELGIDMSQFPSAKHFGCWLGLSPHAKTSGRYIDRRRSKPTASRAAWAFRQAARSLHRSKSALGAFFRRMKSRLGAPKAITAAAYKLARIVYQLFKHGTAYVAQGMAQYELQFQQRMLRNLQRRAAELGYLLVPATQTP
jgi:transposase